MQRLAFLLAFCLLGAGKPDANRLNFLDDNSPYHPSQASAKLITPQWVGEPGVEAVVVLAIDDMRDPAKYEAYLRPILERLKAIDGRAALSIMTNQVDPKSPQLQAWIKEGLNIDVHTLTHPCPLLQKSDFPAAAQTYHGCVDLLSQIPNNQPVAFRMPCCDSINSPTPRFFSEIFNKTSKSGQFLTIDSSIFMRFTPDDPSLPRNLVTDANGRDRFQKYLPFKSFVNTIDNYPYPFIINRLCWEFPCVVPSDWEAQHVQKPNNPLTVEDMKAALDATVAKQGVFNLVFHPHGWIKNSQVVDLIDHAVKTHGSKVKFLNFREAQERLNTHLLGGETVRAKDGTDHGVRILDFNHDGYNDVVIANASTRKTRVWIPESKTWKTLEFPTAIVGAETHFGFVTDPLHPAVLVARDGEISGFQFDGTTWRSEPNLVKLPDTHPNLQRGFRLRDLDHDGVCELLIATPGASGVYQWSSEERAWRELPFRFPEHAWIAYMNGDDAGLRFIDINEDGFDDILFSNDEEFGVYLFTTIKEGWSKRVMRGRPGDPGAIPKIVSGGTDLGAFVHSRHLWWQNEDTSKLPDLVDRRSFRELLKPIEPPANIRQLGAEDTKSDEQRIAAILLGGRTAEEQSADREWLAELLHPRISGEIQSAALDAFRRGDDPKLPEVLLAARQLVTPAVWSSILDLLLARDAWTSSLLSSLEDRCTPFDEVGPVHRRRMLHHLNPTIKERALAVFGVEAATECPSLPISPR